MVIDAAAVLTLLLRQKGADEIADRLREAKGNVHAPHLLDVEVAQVLRRLAAAAPESEPRCRKALQDLRSMPIYRHPPDDLLEDAWELRDTMGSNEAFYEALARRRSEALLKYKHGTVVVEQANA